MLQNIDFIKIFRLMIKHWWKIILIVIAIGIAVSGFEFQGKNTTFHKDPIYQKKAGDKE